MPFHTDNTAFWAGHRRSKGRLGLWWVRGTPASLCKYYGGHAERAWDKAYKLPSTAHAYALVYCSVHLQRINSFQRRNPSLGYDVS